MSVKEDFIKVISYSQGIPEPKVDDLFDRFLCAKKDFISIFGDKFIYEFPETFTFELDQKEKQKRINDLKDIVEWRYNNDELVRFIESVSGSFYNNMTPEDYFCEDGTKIQKGTRIVKAFKFFEDDKFVLSEIQNLASQIIQEDKVSGKLCVSVHPLDFLSISENAHNWRSCHALDGDYCGGNLSYMLDSSTFICYLKSEKDTQISNFPPDVKWNSKKWRVLMYISDDWSMFAAGRQYPFSSDIALNEIKNKIAELFGRMSLSPWTPTVKYFFGLNNKKVSLEYPHVIVGGGLKVKNDVIKDCKNPLHYNDLLHSSCYEPVFTYRRNKWWNGNKYYGISSLATSISVGGTPKCLRCGESDITSTGTMMCNDCEEEYGTDINDNFVYCDCCGRRVHVNNTHWINDSQEVCTDCLENVLYRCECCGYYFYEDDIIYNREGGYYECYDCHQMEERE